MIARASLVVVVSLVALVSAAPARADDDTDVPAVAVETAPLPPLPPPAAPAPAPPAAAPAPLAVTPPPKATCADEPCEKEPKPTRGSGYFGLRVQYTSARGASVTRDATSVSAAGAVEVYNDESSALASRTALAFALGGGSGGVEGLFGGAILVGARARVAPTHGPFGRLGLSGEYQGNSRYLYSRFDLPIGELGYQFVDGPTLFEVGARLSPILTGRIRTGADDLASNNAISYGAFLAARGEIGRVDLTFTRQSLPGPTALSPIMNTFQGRGCLSPIAFFVACLEGQIMGASRGVFGDEPAIATVGGTLGFGAFGAKSERTRAGK